MKNVDAAPTYYTNKTPDHKSAVSQTNLGAYLGNNTQAVKLLIEDRARLEFIQFHTPYQLDAAASSYAYRTDVAAYTSVYSVFLFIPTDKVHFNTSFILNSNADPHNQSVRFQFILGSTTINVTSTNSQGSGTGVTKLYQDLSIFAGQRVTFNIQLKNDDADADYAHLQQVVLMLCRTAQFL